ncbi:putative plant SNARE 12 [Apostasia shenzhenica]|uniref:Putative plant SNARE 12 n=1 Tax=Apostasia shenzhenica TaxID=1088818 RepID=A0A2I0ACM6_9ASPA|nr:putative plant SNARE 12 [Apostasia shenzhenica]
MRDCKRLIKEFDRELKEEESENSPSVNRMLNERKQSMIKELNSYVALKKQYTNSLGNKRIELFDTSVVGDGPGEDNVFQASTMTDQQLMDAGNSMMNDTDQAIERSKKVRRYLRILSFRMGIQIIKKTEQMSRIVNELDSIHFSIKKASQLVKEIGRQVATDRCIMALLCLIVAGVIAVIIVKV